MPVEELHANIEQRLALLAIEVAQLCGELSNPADEVLNSLDRIREKTSTIAADVQALAFELRPNKLE